LFQVKIFGITDPADALRAARAGADAVGLNFYAASPRFVSDERAEEIVAALPSQVQRVGVFVNEPAAAILDRQRRLRLDLIQLHGDETPADVANLGNCGVIKAFRLGPEGFDEVLKFAAACRRQHTPLAAVLVDAQRGTSYGGTGQTANWGMAAALGRALGELPLILAGGLNAANVAQAISAVGPAGVDTASGVESAPGRKDEALLEAFINAARKSLPPVHGTT
jgi:phosphoribosylanthranilate isomerase